MSLTSAAVQTAVGAMQRISDSSPGERGQRASVLVLVLRTVEELSSGLSTTDFLLRRADEEIDRIRSRGERSHLRRLLTGMMAGHYLVVASFLREYALDLGEARRIAEAKAVIDLARSLDPASAVLALTAGRLARLDGDRDAALGLYAAARQLDAGNGSIGRLAAIGEAVVGLDPFAALGRVIREAIRKGDREAAAVGLEERGRLRRSEGDRAGALRDFVIATARFTDLVDRGRMCHLITDVLVASQDLAAARETLLFTLMTGDRSQRDHARARLHTISRDLGDQIGMRRWRSFERTRLVSLSVAPARESASRVQSVRRWQRRLAPLMVAAD